MRLGEKHRQIGLWGHHPNRVIATRHWPRSPRPEHLGYAGRRVPVSRKWSGKTLKDHRGDRKAWLIATLSLEPPDPASTPGKRGRAIHGRIGVERGDNLDVAQRPGRQPGACPAAGGGLWIHARDSSRMRSSHTTEVYGSLS